MLQYRDLRPLEDVGGAQMTAQSRRRPDILEALRHLSHRCFELMDFRAVCTLSDRASVGGWLSCARSRVIWWCPQSLGDN
eukprot:3936032-Pyramimonas_sp.AAC.2